jgi:hypothetical protein
MSYWSSLEIGGKWAMVPTSRIVDDATELERLAVAWNSMRDALLVWRHANARPFARAGMYPRLPSRNRRAEAARTEAARRSRTPALRSCSASSPMPRVECSTPG